MSMNLVIDKFVDAASLSPDDRAALARAQSATNGELRSILAIVGLVMACALALSSWQQPDHFAIALWALVVIIVQGGELAVRRLAQSSPDRTVSGAVLTAAVHGAIWGSVLFALPLGDTKLLLLQVTAVGAMVFCHAASRVIAPQPAFGLAASLLAFGALSVIRLANVPEVLALLTLLAVGLAGFLSLSIWQSRIFVAQWRAGRRDHDQQQVISLLLNEDEVGAHTWLWGFDGNGEINRVSSGLTTATGLAADNLMSLDFMAFLSHVTAPDDLVMQLLRRGVAERQSFTDMDLKINAGPDGRWWRLSGRPAFNEAGSYLGYIGTGTDISERRQIEQRMSMLAHNDPLSGLHNRTKFTETLNQCVARLERYGTPFALLYLDLDNFKLINDSRGHMAGDKLLAEIARRISARVRDVDFVARLGGDEFAVIVTSGWSEELCAGLAGRLIESIAQPIDIDGEELSVGVSIGIAIAPVNGTRPDQLQRNADLALYRAKQDGRSVYRFFESQMDSDARERRLLEMELRDAVSNGELVLYYQPLVAASDKLTSGFEALMRWQHPIRGLVSPAEFIPIAEQSSLIVEIGDWTIADACRTAADWPDHLTVAVNLSAKHFRLSDIASVVQKALDESGLSPHRLELEVTEGLLMDNAEDVTAKLEQLQTLGVTIVMDDFGTGYSSLSYLLKFPFDKIKIDRSFVAASTSDPMARDILRAIASLGKTLRLSITAEGVETPEQAEFLSEIACHQLQGFYFARPLNPVDLPRYLLSTFTKSNEEISRGAALSDVHSTPGHSIRQNLKAAS